MEQTLTRPKTTPRDFFLYVGAMVTLYWSAGSLMALFFAIVDAVIHDNLDYYVDPYSGGIRFAIASLVVIFPISLILFTVLKRDALKQPERFLLPLRRWLYALTVFVTSVALIGDIVALLNSFLGGELTTRFLLKAVAVLVVAGLVFWFSLLEMKIKPDQPMGVRKPFLWGTALLVLATIVYGFAVMGSPTTIRKMRFDERRVGDLSMLQNQIVFNFWQLKGRLPKTLEELNDPISGVALPSDPDTGKGYGYSTDSAKTFSLCANFDLPSATTNTRGVKTAPTLVSPVGYGESKGQDFTHSAGRICFERTIDSELYPYTKR